MAWTWHVTEGGKGEVFGTFNAVLSDSSGIPLGIDLATRVLSTIDYAHHEIHAGSHHYLNGFVEISAGTTYLIKMVTPDLTKWPHFIWNLSSSGICEAALWEGASDGMLGGTSITALNSNRNVTGTSPFAFTLGVTVPSGYGLRIDSSKWGAAGFKSQIGGGSSRDDEVILKQDTTYLGVLTSGAADNIIQFKASWYEHTSKT